MRVYCPIFDIKTGFTQRNLRLLPHARCHEQFYVYRIYDRIFFLTFLFSVSQQFLDSEHGVGDGFAADVLDLYPQWLVCVSASVSVCVCMLGLLAFGALWSDILINCTLACWNGPTCNRVSERGRKKASSERHSFMSDLQLPRGYVVACTWLKFHLSHLQWLLALPLLLCLLFYG